MKHLLKTTLAIIISYAIMSFITWDWNITTWEYYERVGVLTITLLVWLIMTLVETADRSLNDESTRNDEILDSYYKDKRYWINKK
jgi:uncharacterized membrane protein